MFLKLNEHIPLVFLTEMALKILDVEIRKPKDVLKVARLTDPLSKFNVRSKNRRKNFVSMIQETFSRND
jgi:hypothetical protein